MAQPGRRPRLRRVLRPVPPSDDDGEIVLAVRGGQAEALTPGDALYRVVAVVRPTWLGDEGPGGPRAKEHRSEQKEVQHLAAVAGMPVPVLEAAVGAAREAALELLAQVGAAAVALVDGGTTDPRLLRAVRAMAQRMGPVVRQSEAQPTDLVSRAEAARLIGASHQAVYLAVSAGRLPTYGEGEARLVSLREARMLVGGPSIAVSRPPQGAGGDGQESAVESAPSLGTDEVGWHGATAAESAPPHHASETAPTATERPEAETSPRVLLADIVADRTLRFLRDKLREWVRWVDAEPDGQTYQRNIANPPEDTPPPLDRRDAAQAPGFSPYRYPYPSDRPLCARRHTTCSDALSRRPPPLLVDRGLVGNGKALAVGRRSR